MEPQPVETTDRSVETTTGNGGGTVQAKRWGFRAIAGLLTLLIGCLMVLGGIAGWFTVRAELIEENITVAEDADHFAGKRVDGPFSAYSQAEIVQEHVLDATGGKTYAQLDLEDPDRVMALQGSTVRSALMTSVLSFGVSALAAGTGVALILIGAVLGGRASRTE